MRERARLLEGRLSEDLGNFPVVAVAGLRQSGKTTVARRVPGRHYVTLDDLGALEAAERDPKGFLASLPRPLTIDEVQRVPRLMLAVKEIVDRKRRPGEFLLTGSSRIEFRSALRDSLAGRVATLRMRPMTWSEAEGRPGWNPVDRLLKCPSTREALAGVPAGRSLDGPKVLAGGLPPAILGKAGVARRRWFEAYRSAYVERDVPPLMRIDEVAAFVRFLRLGAVRTSQTVNYASLGRDAGVSTDTSLRWAGVLEATFLADFLEPWWRNLGKRLVKSPKLHLGDAGLAGALMGVASWEGAVQQGVSGPLLETLVVQHAYAFAGACREKTELLHYRTHAGAEVDLVLSRGRRLLPVEVKSTRTPTARDARGIEAFLADAGTAAPFGVLLHGGDQAIPLGRSVVALPAAGFLAGA